MHSFLSVHRPVSACACVVTPACKVSGCVESVGHALTVVLLAYMLMHTHIPIKTGKKRPRISQQKERAEVVCLQPRIALVCTLACLLGACGGPAT